MTIDPGYYGLVAVRRKDAHEATTTQTKEWLDEHADEYEAVPPDTGDEDEDEDEDVFAAAADGIAALAAAGMTEDEDRQIDTGPPGFGDTFGVNAGDEGTD